MTRVPALAALAGVGTAAVLFLGPQGSIWTGVLFVVLFALTESANTVSWAITGHFFGRKNFATLRGGVELIQSLLSVPGPVLAGWIFDRNSSYTRVLLPIVGFYLLASVLYWTLRRPAKPARWP
jgi:nitrate/nitrite transporter NarK